MTWPPTSITSAPAVPGFDDVMEALGSGAWDDEPLRQALIGQGAQQLGHDDGVLVFDPSAFPTSGTASVGVARQWWLALRLCALALIVVAFVKDPTLALIAFLVFSWWMGWISPGGL